VWKMTDRDPGKREAPPARVPSERELEIRRQLENGELPPDDPLMRLQAAIDGLRSLIKS
jgi:hypothetical protein